MESALVGVIIGALIGAIPNLASVLLSFIDKSSDRKHELRKMEIEVYHKEKLAALKQYRLAFSEICANIKDIGCWQAFKSASDVLDMMVSDSTHDVLKKVNREIDDHHLYQHYAPGEHIFFPNELEDELLTTLRFEMDALHRSSGLKKTFEILSSSPVVSVNENNHQASDAVEHNTEESSQHDAVKPL